MKPSSKRALMTLIMSASVLLPLAAEASPKFKFYRHHQTPTAVPELSTAAGGTSAVLLAGVGLLLTAKRRRAAAPARSN